MIELWYSWSLQSNADISPPSDLAILMFTLFHRTYGTGAAHGDVTRWQHSSIRCGWRDVATVEVFCSRSSEKENSCVNAECCTKDNDEEWHQMMSSGIRWDVYHSVAIINSVWLWKDVNVKWIVVTYTVTAIQNMFVILLCTWWIVSLCCSYLVGGEDIFKFYVWNYRNIQLSLCLRNIGNDCLCVVYGMMTSLFSNASNALSLKILLRHVYSSLNTASWLTI